MIAKLCEYIHPRTSNELRSSKASHRAFVPRTVQLDTSLLELPAADVALLCGEAGEAVMALISRSADTQLERVLEHFHRQASTF